MLQQMPPTGITLTVVVFQNVTNMIAKRARGDMRGEVKDLHLPESIGAKQRKHDVLSPALERQPIRLQRTGELTSHFICHSNGGGVLVFRDGKNVKRGNDLHGFFRPFAFATDETAERRGR